MVRWKQNATIKEAVSEGGGGVELKKPETLKAKRDKEKEVVDKDVEQREEEKEKEVAEKDAEQVEEDREKEVADKDAEQGDVKAVTKNKYNASLKTYSQSLHGSFC